MGWWLSFAIGYTIWAFQQGTLDAALGGLIVAMLLGVCWVFTLFESAFDRKSKS
jgi:hypothetical protein